MNYHSCSQLSHERCFKVLNARCEGVRTSIDYVLCDLTDWLFLIWLMYPSCYFYIPEWKTSLILQLVLTSFPKMLYMCACVCVWRGDGGRCIICAFRVHWHLLSFLLYCPNYSKLILLVSAVCFQRKIIWLIQTSLFQI